MGDDNPAVLVFQNKRFSVVTLTYLGIYNVRDLNVPAM